MSKKVLNYAGKRPMLLALIIMATFTLGLLFSGWLTPTPSKAQPSQPDPTPNQENCAASTNVLSGTPPSVVTNSSVSPTSIIVCYSNAPIMPTTIIAPVYGTNNIFTLAITDTNCNTTTNTENVTYSVSGVFWTNITTAPYTNFPANVTNSFSADADVFVTSSDTNLCSSPGIINLATVAWKPEQVTSLTPSAGVLAPNSTSIWLVQYGCSPTITVTAGDSLGLSPSDLPSCWTITTLTGTATEIDPMHFSIDGNTTVASTITINCGSSSQTITIIVYKATVELDAQKGNHVKHLFDFGHSWWNLTIVPTDVYPFLTSIDPITGDLDYLYAMEGPQGMGGFYDHSHLNGPGQVIFQNPQPDQGASTQAGYPVYHHATGTYWWCVSFNSYINALLYVYDLAYINTPEYRVMSDNCTTEAEAVADVAGVQNVPPTIYPGILSNWLNGNSVVLTGVTTTYLLPQPPTCSCSQSQ